MKSHSKKRILLCSEANHLATGYSVYTKEMLGRLHSLYDVAEFATYGSDVDPKLHDVPWKVYPNEPDKSTESMIEYQSDELNRFGAWRFEEVLLDFRPDIVIDIRDVYVVNYQANSPLRQYYRWLYMPTIDSIPLDNQWVHMLLNTDGLLSYSNFGKNYIESVCQGQVPYYGLGSPGGNPHTFFPARSKQQHKAQMGLDDTLIVGTVMRNQFRKLYPELFEHFRMFLDSNPDLAQKTYLYCHTSYPDLGWKLPRYLMKYGLGHKVLFTYVCHNCNAVMPLFFQDVRTVCTKCNNLKMYLPKPKHGIPDTALNNIYNIMDVYVQYSNSGGFEMPIVEAAYAGLPIMTNDCTAMSDFKDTIGAIPIQTRTEILDHGSESYRGYPDGHDFISKLRDILIKPPQLRNAIGITSQHKAHKEYNWDKTVQNWINAIESTPPPERSWDDSPQLIGDVVDAFPQGLNNIEFIEWTFKNTLKRPHMTNSYIANKLLSDLNWGLRLEKHGSNYSYDMSIQNASVFYAFGQSEAFYEILGIAEKLDYWEKRRCNIIKAKRKHYLCH